MKAINLLLPSLTVIFVLLLAVLGNLFTPGFNWDLFDFIVMGLMIFAVGFIIELIFLKIKKRKNRIILIMILLLTFLYAWAELGVGIFFNFGN